MAVLINGRTAVHKDSNGKVLTVDVCLTKVGKYTVPIPYMNMAQSSDSDKTAGGVFIDGNPACHKDSTFSKSRGDEPGNKKGIRSRKKGDYASFIMGSANVQFEGTPAVRALELMVSNARNTPPSPLMQAVGLPPLPKQAASEDALAPFVGPFFEPVIQEGRSGLRTRELVASLEDPHSQPEHEAFTLSEAGEIILSGLHRAATHMALVCKETTPWEHKPNDRILLPLCEARHSRIGEEAEYHDIALQALTLKRYLSPDADPEDTDKLREGWLYVFVNGYLWREQQVTEHGYRDVDLHTWHGTDGPDDQQRPATGTLNDHLTVPHHLEGTPAAVQIAFSEVQWSWERISEFGGMKEDDARLFHKVEEDETLTDIARYYPGTSVDQLAELNGLDDPDQIQAGQLLKLRDLPSPPADADDRRTKRMGEEIDFDEAEAQDYEWTVADPLGVVEALSNAAKGVLYNHQQILNSLQGAHLPDSEENQPSTGPDNLYFWHSYQEEQSGSIVRPDMPQLRQSGEHWRKHCENMTTMAQMIYPGFFDDASIETLDEETREQINDAAAKMSKEQLVDWLHVKERKAMRKAFREMKRELNQALLEELPQSEGLYQAMRDYALLPAHSYSTLWARLNELTGPLLVDPTSADHNYDLPSEVEAEQSEEDGECLTFLVCITHPQRNEQARQWHEMLFPTEEQVDLSSEAEPMYNKLPEPERYSPKFKPQTFAASLDLLAEEQAHNPGNALTARRLFDVLDRSVNALVVLGERLPNLPQYQYNGDVFLRLLKGSKLPVLKNLSVNVGDSIAEGAIPPGQYRVQEVIEAEQAQIVKRKARKAAKMSDQKVTIMDSRGRAFAGSDFRSTTPYLGQTQPLAKITNARDLFETGGRVSNKDAIYRSRTSMVLVPNDIYSKALQNYSDAVKKASDKGHSLSQSVVYRGFPTALLGLEVLNLSRKVKELSELRKQDKIELGGVITTALESSIKITAASFQAREAWMGNSKLFTDSLRESRHSALRISARPMSIRGLRFPVYSGIIFIGTLIDFGYNMSESYLLFKQNNYDAAAAMAVGALIFLTGGALGLKSAGAALTASAAGAGVGAAGIAIPVIGLLIAAGGLAFIYWANVLRNTPLEYWGNNGPFSRVSRRRLSQEDLANSDLALLALQNLLISPSVSLKWDRTQEPQEGNIWVQADFKFPAFISGVSETYMSMNVERWNESHAGSHLRTQTIEDFTPEVATNIPASNQGPETIRCHFRVSRFTMTTSHYRWKARVRHQISSETNLPLAEDPAELGWFEGNLRT